MLFNTLVSAALVASTAFAQPIQQHQHHQHEKKAVVITNTIIVTAGAPGPQAAAQVATGSPQPSSSASESAETTTVASSSAPEAPSSASASEVPSSPSSAPSGGSFSAGAKGVTYSPYNSDNSCKSASQVKSDIAKLSDYSLIRLYGTDCNQVENVLPALADGQEVFLGIFDVSNIESQVENLAKVVKNNGGWNRVHTVSVGNELVNAGQANPSQIKQYVNTAKSALKSAGYTGPVVSVDTFIAVINNPDLCDASDYIAVNAHAFFDGHVTAQEAGKWLLGQIQRVSSACGNKKKVFITETGWPTRGDSNNVAVPSTQNQKDALEAIASHCGNDATYFNAFNDMWKQPGAFNAEQYWGIIHE